VADQTIYRCINDACARTMPRPVNFCPYCGTAQTAVARTQAGRQAQDDGEGARRAAAAAAHVAPAAGAAGSSAAAVSVSAMRAEAAVAASVPPVVAPAPAASAPPQPAGAAAARAQAAAPPSATAFGHGAGNETVGTTAAGATAAPARGRGIPWSPKPAAPTGPGGRTPVRLRWWILLLAVLWGVWLVARPPSGKKIEGRIDAAIALAQACKSKPAQDELIALRSGRASPEQLARLQRGLNEAAAACTRKRQRDKAWNDAGAAVESALAAGNYERAQTRLQGFTRRWGEDKETRALKDRIDEGRHPLAAPESSSSTSATTQSARNLLQEARADLARGDPAAARDKMVLCLDMVDAADQACAALKAQAERTLGAQ
jgi:hypothetical protein